MNIKFKILKIHYTRLKNIYLYRFTNLLLFLFQINNFINATNIRNYVINTFESLKLNK